MIYDRGPLRSSTYPNVGNGPSGNFQSLDFLWGLPYGCVKVYNWVLETIYWCMYIIDIYCISDAVIICIFKYGAKVWNLKFHNIGIVSMNKENLQKSPRLIPGKRKVVEKAINHRFNWGKLTMQRRNQIKQQKLQ